MVGNGFHVIDAHCHIYPDKIAQKAEGAIENFYHVHGFGDGTLGMLLREGDRAGIDQYVVQSVATKPSQVRGINRFIASAVAENHGRLIGLGTLHPESEDLEGDVENLLSLGLHGVKLHPDIQGFKIDDYRCLKIYELCEREQLPILMHTGDSRYDNSNPNRLLPVMRIYTGLTVIGAHFGGWSLWEEASRKLSGLPNLYVDCSSSFQWLTDTAIKEIIARYGVDRVLFGTDYPMWSPHEELRRLLSLGYSDSEYRQLLSENAVKAYRL
ncbi:MAG: amidohydrolase family protein [Eubacterium sp.]|nr:amidohydrolase family protein [Eubacterium sp.]